MANKVFTIKRDKVDCIETGQLLQKIISKINRGGAFISAAMIGDELRVCSPNMNSINALSSELEKHFLIESKTK